VAGSSFKTSIKMTGPFFDHDPAKTWGNNAHNMMVGVAREGSADVRGAMAAGNAGRAAIQKIGDHVSDHVRGELRKRPSGSNYTAMVFVENRGFSAKEGISLMAAASQVESQTHAVRKTTGRISRSRAVNVSELLKGLT
jgi:hypothetical protein